MAGVSAFLSNSWSSSSSSRNCGGGDLVGIGVGTVWVGVASSSLHCCVLVVDASTPSAPSGGGGVVLPGVSTAVTAGGAAGELSTAVPGTGALEEEV